MASAFAKHIDKHLEAEKGYETEQENWEREMQNGTLQLSVYVDGEPEASYAEKPWPKIYKQFQAIHNLSDVASSAMGSVVVWYLAEGLMYYSIHLNTLFITDDWFKRFYSLLFFVITFHILYVSADICSQVHKHKFYCLVFV